MSFLFGGGRLSNLVTCIVLREGDGWTVTWASDGKTPRDYYAPSLSRAIDIAAADISQMYNGKREAASAELQFAIYPWQEGAGEVILDVTRDAEGLDAKDIQGSGVSFHAASIEAVVEDGARYLPNPSDAMIRWIRRVSEL